MKECDPQDGGLWSATFRHRPILARRAVKDITIAPTVGLQLDERMTVNKMAFSPCRMASLISLFSGPRSIVQSRELYLPFWSSAVRWRIL
jgi:hypothetical protein